MIHRAFVFVFVGLTPMATLAQPPAPLPDGAIARLGTPRFAMQSSYGIALSPDGKLIAAGSYKSESAKTPGGIVIWDAETAKILRTTEPSGIFQNNYLYTDLVWSGNGRRIAANRSGVVQIWDVETGKRLWEKDFGTGFGYGMQAGFRFVDHDRLLAVAGKNHDKKAWHVELVETTAKGGRTSWAMKDAQIETLLALGKDFTIRHVGLSPAGTRTVWLASPPPDARNARSAVFIYETATGKYLGGWSDLPLAYRVDLPDEAETLVLYPLRTEHVERITTGNATVLNLADGKVRFRYPYRFAAASRVHYSDPIVKEYTSWRHVNTAAFRYRDTLVIPDELGLTRWSATGKKLEEFNEPYTNIAVASDGKHVAVRHGMRISTTSGDLALLAESATFSAAPALRFLPDGRLRCFDNPEAAGMSYLYEPRQGKLLQTQRLYGFPGGRHANVPCRNRYDAKLSTAIDFRGSKRVMAFYDLTTGAAITSWPTELDGAVSADGRRVLALADNNGSNRAIWIDIRSNRRLGSWVIPLSLVQIDGKPRSILQEPCWLADDGSSIGFIDAKGRFTVVDCARNRVVVSVGVTPSTAWKSPVWRADSAGFHRILWARPQEYSIIGVEHNWHAAEHVLWDRQGRFLRRFSLPHVTFDERAILSPDGRTVATITSEGEEITLIETATGRVRGRIAHAIGGWLHYQAHPDLRACDFSPDCSMLATNCWKTATVLVWDLARPLAGQAALPPPKSAKEAEALWDKLGDPDPVESDRALRALVQAPEHTLAMLKARLAPMPTPDAKAMQDLIKKLDSGNFAERDAAMRELRNLNESTVPVLRDALKSARSLEHRRRIDTVIESLTTGIETPGPLANSLRALRALEVLERIGTPESRKIVEAMANGADAIPTYEAQLVLVRWPETARRRTAGENAP